MSATDDSSVTHELEQLRERLATVFASGDPRLQRLSAAGTSVSLRFAGAPQASVTILLDREPPALADGDEPAEITLELTTEQGIQLLTGVLAAPAALLSGRIPYRGPVRKYLAIHPVLRGLLADLAAARLGRG